MKLQDEEWELFSNKMLAAQNIYDVLVVMYEIVDNGNSPSYISNYYEYIDKVEENAWGNSSVIIDELLNKDIDFSSFLRQLILLLDKNNVRLYSIHWLLMFDHFFLDKEQYPYFELNRNVKINYVYSFGPLNTITDKYRLYYSPPKGIIKNSYAVGMSKFRTINRKDGTSIFYNIENYQIIEVRNNKPEIIIKYYNQTDFPKIYENKNSQIKVGIIPVSKKPWFSPKFTINNSNKSKCVNYFEIMDNIENIDDVNNSFVNMIEHLSEKGVDIVVFPELAMNSRTKVFVKNYLINKSLSNNNFSIKLVFLGSYWHDGINECFILSGKGTELVNNNKKSPFTIEKDNKEYLEKLSKRPEKYEMLDVYGLGRILYLICKDGLDDLSQISLWNEYEANLQVISSYSPSISYFENQARDFAKNYQGITILANCCAPRIKPELDNEKIGFVSTPVMRKTEPYILEGMINHYYSGERCEECCLYCECVHIFGINPYQYYEDNNCKGLTVNYELSYNANLITESS